MTKPSGWAIRIVAFFVSLWVIGEGVQAFTTATFGGGPGPRDLYFKLPLKQPRFHWKFYDREALLAGSLEVEIHGASGQDTVLTVFENGAMSTGWHVIESDRGEGEVYFGFYSEPEVWTEAHDSVVIRLVAAEDLSGIGRYHTAVLPAGEYRATASYSVLTGHPTLGRVFPRLNREDPTAFISCWRRKWDQEVTKKEGWAGPWEEDSDRSVGGWLGDVLEFVFRDRGTDGFRCLE